MSLFEVFLGTCLSTVIVKKQDLKEGLQFHVLFHLLFSVFLAFSLKVFISHVVRSLIFRCVVRCVAMLVVQLERNSFCFFLCCRLCIDGTPVDRSFCLIFGLTVPAINWIFRVT